MSSPHRAPEPRPRAHRALLALALVALAACRAADSGPARSLAELPAPAPLAPETSLPTAFSDAAGFDPLVPMPTPGDVRPGDRALYRVTAHDGSGARQWLLRSELVRTYGTYTFRGTLTAADGQITKIERRTTAYECAVMVLASGADAADELLLSTLLLPRLSMERNLFSAASAMADFRASGATELSEADRDRFVEGLFTSVALFEGWQENETLAGLLREVVGAPSLLGALGSLFSGGPVIELSVKLEEARAAPARLPAPVGELPGWWVPFELSLGGDVLLYGELHTVAPAAPLSLGLGVVAVRGAHPRDPERWMQAQLVGARRPR